VPELSGLKKALDVMVYRLAGALNSGQRVRRLALEKLCASGVLIWPKRALTEPRRAQVDALERRLALAVQQRQERDRRRLETLDASLRALDPKAVLDRGYAVIRQGTRIVSRTAGVDKAAPVRICFSDGELTADITAAAGRDDAI